MGLFIVERGASDVCFSAMPSRLHDASRREGKCVTLDIIRSMRVHQESPVDPIVKMQRINMVKELIRDLPVSPRRIKWGTLYNTKVPSQLVLRQDTSTVEMHLYGNLFRTVVERGDYVDNYWFCKENGMSTLGAWYLAAAMMNDEWHGGLCLRTTTPGHSQWNGICCKGANGRDRGANSYRFAIIDPGVRKLFAKTKARRYYGMNDLFTRAHYDGIRLSPIPARTDQFFTDMQAACPNGNFDFAEADRLIQEYTEDMIVMWRELLTDRPLDPRRPR